MRAVATLRMIYDMMMGKREKLLVGRLLALDTVRMESEGDDMGKDEKAVPKRKKNALSHGVGAQMDRCI